MNSESPISHPLLKLASVATAWLAAMTWGEIASMLATFYTLLLISEFFWRRFWRPMFRHFGVLRAKHREFEDSTGRGGL